MKFVSTCLLIALFGALTFAQSANAAKPVARAVIEGIVIKDPSGEPVKKAVIEVIAENQAEGGDYTAVTGADGKFHIEGIVPGKYHLFAERTGFLEVDKHHIPSVGRVLTLSAGQEVKDVLIRLQAAAVVQGRVVDEDGDPLPNAQVTMLRQTFASGHSRWEQLGGERTNDLGEYRVAGLPAGNYYVSVNPPPDFKSLIEAADGAKGDAGNTGANDKPATSYQTTYYPGTPDRSQATPIQLHAGEDFPINFSLTPGPSLSIRGSVVGLPPQSSAVIMLQSHDFNLVLNGAQVHQDGSFVMHDISPGAYTILATVENSPVPMMARQALQVGAGGVEGLRLAPQPGARIRGRLRIESTSNNGKIDLSHIFLSLRPVDGDEDTFGMMIGQGFSADAHVAADGTFEWINAPPGNYRVQLLGNDDSGTGLFMKSVITGSRENGDASISVNGGAVVLDLVASTNGGMVEGVAVSSKGEPVANAVIVAVPEGRMRGRVDRYVKTVSDQSGRFMLRGMPPGDYTLFAWESVDGEAYYNPEFLKNYEAQGIGLRIIEGERKTLQVQAIPVAEEEQ